MDAPTWITYRLPPDHGFTTQHITDVLNDPEGADGVRELGLADLLEELAAQDRYQSETIGNTSVSNPLLMERARIWRDRAPKAVPDSPPGSFQFIPIKGRSPAQLYDEFGAPEA